MSPNGFGQQQPSLDLSPGWRLNLLLLENQRMQQEAMRAQMQVPPIPLVDIVAHQGGQMPQETVGEWSLVPSEHPSSSSQLPMVAEQDSRGFENSSLQLSASAAQSSAQISTNQNLQTMNCINKNHTN